MKRAISFFLALVIVASLGVLFGACGSSGTKDGIYFDAIEDENGQMSCAI